MHWRDIPSLAALRAFEAAARAGSFTVAARELNVTQAAVAQHVRNVEAHLGTALLIRQGRGMALTDTGATLAATLAEGFGQIIDGVRAVSETADARPLTISVTSSFAENWLVPRLTRFWATHPGFSLSITPSTKVVDLRRDGFDMAIRYGKGSWPGIEATKLVAGDFTVVAAPSLMNGRQVNGFADLYDLPWLFVTNHGEARQWAENAGMDFVCCQVIEVATLSMVLSAIRTGGGVSVVSSALVLDDIATGRLVALMPSEQQGLDYHIVHAPGVLSDRVKTLKSWLLKADQPSTQSKKAQDQ
jgi:LysR family glycine cleavage system transcriptional activator